MSATYEPGTNAMVTAYNRSTPYRAFFDGKTWRDCEFASFCVDAPTSLHPLVVLDPEDRVTLQKFAAWTADGDYADWRIDWVRSFLRSLIAPPKPLEPTDLGAQVRDRDGEMWVRNVQGAWINLHGRYGLDPARTWDGLCEKYGPIEVAS